MKTRITFKGIGSDREIKYRTIAIEHPDFQPIHVPSLSGPDIDVPEQVMEWMRDQNLEDLMVKHDFYLILDYWPVKKRKKKTSSSEVAEFAQFCQEVCKDIPGLKRSIEATVSEHGKYLFGHGKTNKEKLEEVLAIRDMCYKIASGTLDMISKQLDNDESTIRISGEASDTGAARSKIH
jgi:hypothetical protein